MSGVAACVAVAVIANFGLMAHLILDATGLTWTAFAAAHWRGAVLAVMVTALVAPVAVVADRVGLFPAVTLAVACALCALLLPVLRAHRGALRAGRPWLTARLRSKTSPADRPAVELSS